MPAIDTDELSSQFVSMYRDNVFCNQQKVYTYMIVHVHVHACVHVVHCTVIINTCFNPDGDEIWQDHVGSKGLANDR